ncbi:MAG: hypothetical protein K2V38_17020, partial [Gemmataceae bacterium]|nr:hypothetical protein [Gemmataceae bacterium]
PCHTVCSEEGSSARAIELGVRALRAGELDRALVGGVDLAGDPRARVVTDPRHVPGEGAVALVLKRLSDAQRDGDRVYAVIRGVGVAGDPGEAVARATRELGEPLSPTTPALDAARRAGDLGAASGAASLLLACAAVDQEILPPSAPGEQLAYWLTNAADGPRRSLVQNGGADGTRFAFVLEEAPGKPHLPARAQPLGARAEAAFVVEGQSPAELLAGLERAAAFVRARADRNIESVAREWVRASPPDASRKLAASFVARSADEFAEQVAFAASSLQAEPESPFQSTARPRIRDRVFYAPKPLGPKAKVAFVFPGSGNQFDGMGRELGVQWPDALRRQQAENELLRDQFGPHLFWAGKLADATPRDLMFGQVTVGSLTSDIALSLGVRCDAMIGLSLGESAGLFGVRVWRGRDEMFRRMQHSPLFASDLAPPFDAARAHWGLTADAPADWVSGVIAAGADDVTAALRPGLRAYLLIVNTPNECVIGGRRADVEKLAAAVGKPVHLLAGVTLAHCEAGRPVAGPYRELHMLPITAQPLTVYSGAWGKSYRPGELACADSITAGLVGTIDVPRVIEAAYRDGVRAFVEMAPG